MSDVRNPFSPNAHAAEQAPRRGTRHLAGKRQREHSAAGPVLDTFISQRVDGVIAAPQGEGSYSLSALLEREIPTVFVDRTVNGIDVPSVTTDSDSGIRQAVEHLAGQGHERDRLHGRTTDDVHGARASQVLRPVRQRAWGLARDPALTYYGDFQAASGSAGAGKPAGPRAAADRDDGRGQSHGSRRAGHAEPEGPAHRRRHGPYAFDDIEWFSLLDRRSPSSPEWKRWDEPRSDCCSKLSTDKSRNQ